MGVYKKYKDNDGEPTGPWFVKYPHKRDKASGKIQYKTEKVGPSKKLAQRIYAKKYEAYKKREHLDWDDTRPLTFKELVKWFVELPVVKETVYYPDVVRNCQRWEKFLGEIAVDDVKPSMVERYREERLKEWSYRGKNKTTRKVAPATVNREVSTLKRMFNLAIREDLASKNPCWKVERLPENNERKRILTQEELDLLLAELPEHAQDVVLTAYYTGMRAGEIFHLTWDKVNLVEGFIELEWDDTKTRKPRRIYANEAVLAILNRLNTVRYLDHNRVFTYQGKPVNSIKSGLKTACDEAGIQDFRFHDLRHTFNTMMRKAGVPKSVIMHLTGHKTSAMFDRYNTVDEEDAKEALEKLDDFLGKKAHEGAETEECSHSAPGAAMSRMRG